MSLAHVESEPRLTVRAVYRPRDCGCICSSLFVVSKQTKQRGTFMLFLDNILVTTYKLSFRRLICVKRLKIKCKKVFELKYLLDSKKPKRNG